MKWRNSSSAPTRTRRRSRRIPALFENLETRQMLAANLHMIEAYWGNANGSKLNSVAVGSQPHLWVNYNVEGIPAGTVYQIRATVNGKTHSVITNLGVNGGMFMGQPVDATAVLVRYTRYGDANLDGQVNLADFNRLAANFGQSGGGWSRGDFNHDDLVNLADFTLAGNFGTTV